MNRKKCLIVCGPTAVGKTDFALELALKNNTSIISADSRQCYKELNIGVAKPSGAQLENVRHYFINSHSIHQDINVKTFETYALKSVAEIFNERDVAVMVGGTGLYIKAFTEGIDNIPETSQAVRGYINDSYKEKGIEWLQQELKVKDPQFYASGEMENPQRLLRALEVKLSSGKSILEFQSNQKAERSFDVEYILLELPRETLYQRINQRVDFMMENGLLDEVKYLYPDRNLKALQTVGYRELFDHIKRKHSLDFAINEIKKNTRQYAKRQMTWFKKYAF